MDKSGCTFISDALIQHNGIGLDILINPSRWIIVPAFV